MAKAPKSTSSDGTTRDSLGGQAAQRLSDAVRTRRRALHLKQAELAALAGVGLAFLYDIEHGKPTARLDKVLAVLAVLGLELHVQPGKQLISISKALVEES